MNVFDMHITLQKVQEHYPEIASDNNKMSIVRALIYSRGSLEAVDFLTDASKIDIVSVYKLLRDIDVFPDMTMPVVDHNAPRQRQFKRIDMINYLKERLLQQHPSLEFTQLKYNVLTCQLGLREIKIYVSTSRDYESAREASDYNPFRVSGWHKGERTIFTNEAYDYFAFLTKIDSNSLYKPNAHNEIEGILLSFTQMQEWLAAKDSYSRMVNYYVHYIQMQDHTNLKTTVYDTRETPHLELTYLFNQPFALIH